MPTRRIGGSGNVDAMEATRYVAVESPDRPAIEVPCECAAMLVVLALGGRFRIMITSHEEPWTFSDVQCRCCRQRRPLDKHHRCAACNFRQVRGWRAGLTA